MLAILLGMSLGGATMELCARFWIEPPPFDSADLRFVERVIKTDAILRYRLRPNLDLPWAEGTKRGTWNGRLRSGSDGWRSPRFEAGSGTPLRVAFLGDSSTMGFYVDDSEHVPSRVGVQLAARYENRRVLSSNYGVIGYTSEQGRRLLATELREPEFDYVVLAYGYNDGFLTKRDEQAWLHAVPSPGWMPFHLRLNEASSLYRVLWSQSHPEREHALLRPRIGRVRFEANLRWMIRRLRAQGIKAIVLDLALPNSYLRECMRTVAAEEDATHICCAEIFERELSAQMESDALAQRIVGNGAQRLRIRAREWKNPVLVAFDLAQQERVALVLPGNDQGILGDEHASDGITTWELELPGSALSYEFCIADLRELERSPENFNYLFYRRLELEAGRGFDSPIYDPESWRRGWDELLLERESVHPSVMGLQRIADEVCRHIAEVEDRAK